jgi:hypothetical protein
MIVVDEQLADPRIILDIRRWYKGKVISINEVRPQTIVPDEVIPALLRELNAPTFVTINFQHFWQKISASPAYCVVCLKLPAERSREVSQMLRTVLSQPTWRTKRERMGNVIFVSGQRVACYSSKRGHIELTTLRRQ